MSLSTDPIGARSVNHRTLKECLKDPKVFQHARYEVIMRRLSQHEWLPDLRTFQTSFSGTESIVSGN